MLAWRDRLGDQRQNHLGRGLISTQPNSDWRQFDERQIVGCELVISGRDTPTLLDLIEEPFDQVARTTRQPTAHLAAHFKRN